MIMPGTNNSISHATCNPGYYGRGMYLSPYPDFASTYSMCSGSRGGTLFVCAVLKGRVYQCTDLMVAGAKMEGYDTHRSPDGNEHIFFQASQILPCYVIHFMDKSIIPPPRNTNFIKRDKPVEPKKKIRKAKITKKYKH